QARTRAGSRAVVDKLESIAICLGLDIQDVLHLAGKDRVTIDAAEYERLRDAERIVWLLENTVSKSDGLFASYNWRTHTWSMSRRYHNPQHNDMWDVASDTYKIGTG